MPESSAAAPNTAAAEQRAGLLQAVAAYGLWGALPLFFLILAPAGSWEIVAFRVLFSLVFCVLIITVTRKWDALLAIVRQPRLVATMGLAAALIIVNWQVYVFGTITGHVVEAALGYFINPLVTVLLGVIVLRERLRVAQWVAVGISTAAVVVLAVGYGRLPWISLVLAFSFGLYGFVKKRVGPRVDALSGLTIETAWLIPVAIGQLFIAAAVDGIAFVNAGPVITLLLLSSGIVTAIPLLLFAAAARRLPLVWIGLTQNLTPALQFVVGVFLLHEAMPPERWIGFALVWLALIVLTADMVAHGRVSRRALPLPG